MGRMTALGFPLREAAELRALTADVLESSEIEGETLDRGQVRSSIARRLGMDVGVGAPADRHVEGIVEMMLDATRDVGRPLTEDRLFGWHAALFPNGCSGLRAILVGRWRDESTGPTRVVSGPIGREHVHYEAPAASRVAREMETFLAWFATRDDLDPVLKAALAHLWFVTIHPFEDGNGRIARAIADLQLARSEDGSPRFYSMSSQLRLERKSYYDILERTQGGGLDVTPWLEWFLVRLDRAIEGSAGILGSVLAKARFWEEHDSSTMNPRQRKVLDRLFDGFEGKLTSSKWAQMTKCSQDTASRDIDALVGRGILVKDAAGGRSTSYSLAPRPA